MTCVVVGKLLAPKLRKSADKSLSQPGCSHSNTNYAVQPQKTIVLRMQPRHRATLTQPPQCDLQRLSCKTTCNGVGNCSFKTGSTPKQKKDDFEAFFKRIFRRKITSAKVEKICCQITIAAWIFPFQYDLRCSTAKDNSITHAAAAPSNLDAATTMRSAETELQNIIELRATVSEIAASKPDGISTPKQKKTILKHFLKGFLEGKLLAPKLRKSAAKSLSQPGCGHSNTIYAVQLQKTIVLRMQPRHRATLTQPPQCDLQRLSCKT